MVTPLTVNIMLACYVSADPSEVVGLNVWGSSAATVSRAFLADNDLVVIDNGNWVVTERGKAWIERMLATPLPVAVWTFPDD